MVGDKFITFSSLWRQISKVKIALGDKFITFIFTHTARYCLLFYTGTNV